MACSVSSDTGPLVFINDLKRRQLKLGWILQFVWILSPQIEPITVDIFDRASQYNADNEQKHTMKAPQVEMENFALDESDTWAHSNERAIQWWKPNKKQ